MKFNDLSKPDFKNFTEVSLKGKNKQNVNLSGVAQDVLKHDYQILNPGSERVQYSTIINTIFLNFHADASSSIGMQLEEQKRKWREQLGSCYTEEVCEKLLKPMKDGMKEDAKERLGRKGVPIKIEIRKETWEKLEHVGDKEKEEPGSPYGDKIGKYLKALMEEYASLPYIEREKYLFADTWEKVDSAQVSGKILKIRYRDKTYWMRPYCIEHDAEQLYNYAAGLSWDDGKTKWNPCCYRISNIRVEGPEHAMRLKGEEKDLLRKDINEKGIQYLTSAMKDFVVEFKGQGEQHYRQWLHLRPEYKSVKEGRYTFHCPEYQFMSYFFKFGDEVKVISPVEEAEKFKDMYTKAAGLYGEGTEI